MKFANGEPHLDRAPRGAERRTFLRQAFPLLRKLSPSRAVPHGATERTMQGKRPVHRNRGAFYRVS